MHKLLVIEDHTLVREGLVNLLAQVEEGVVVADRPDFESALALLEDEDEVDLILLDLALPGIDGFAGLDILRRRYPAIPVVAVSAFDDRPTVARVMNLGASGFIPKSFPENNCSPRCAGFWPARFSDRRAPAKGAPR